MVDTPLTPKTTTFKYLIRVYFSHELEPLEERMKNRTGEDFSGVMTHLHLKNREILEVSIGIYHNPRAKAGSQYAAVFATEDQ
jgi:hypothetical protein